MKLKSRPAASALSKRRDVPQTYASWRASVPSRPTRPHRVDPEGGRLVPVRNTASAQNGKVKPVFVRHAGESRSLRLGRLDKRSALYREYSARVAELTAHVGHPSATQRTLIAHASRAAIIASAAWSEVVRHGAFDASGEMTPALRAWAKASAEERAALATLGYESHANRTPALSDYLAARGRGGGQEL